MRIEGIIRWYNQTRDCVPHKSTHKRTSPLATEIQKMGYCRDLPHCVRHIPHRLRGGAVLNKLKLKGLAAFGAFPVQGLTGAGLPTALHEKSPAQSAELQFVCGERGTLFWRFLFSNLFIIKYLKFQKIIFWTVFDPILTRLAESKVLSANYLGHYSRS